MIVTCPLCKRKFSIAARRKDSHSAVFHAVVGEWCKQLGDGFEKVKRTWKYYYGQWVPYPFEGDPPEWPGQHVTVIDGGIKRSVYMKSTTAYTKREMTELETGAEAECMDADVDLSILVEYDRRKKQAEAERKAHEQSAAKNG